VLERLALIGLGRAAGFSLEEIAEVDGVSVATLKRQWRAARAWLVAELGTS